MHWWIWLVAAVVLLIVEVLTPGGFYFVFFGAGALVTALLALAGIDNVLVQSAICLAVSLSAFAVFRKPLLARFEKGIPSRSVDTLIGETATVAADLHPGEFGQAELRGSNWKVRNISGAAIRAGERCIVEQVDGLTLHIRAAQ
ncbi:MAG TPA: NfeD family protein [Bryobacteraceae bacterium]|nr:NfeD family protein [Bryobacteraceae bacterium]